MKKKTLYIIIAVAIAVLAALVSLLLFWDPVLDALPIDQSGWKDQDGIRYYLDEDGDPITGWQDIGGKTYYFDAETGAMTTGWLELSDGRYHFGSDGTLSTGWLTADGATFYLLADGAMATGWQEIDGKTYCFADTGNPLTGWQTLDEKTYYFAPSGAMQSGWIDLEGTAYYLSEDGSLYSGWMEDGSLYILSDGTIATGWQDIDGVRHCFKEDGTPYAGWQDLDSGRYYFDDQGIMHTGWLELESGTYYLKEDGTIAQGKQIIDEKTYYFTSTGAHIWLVNAWNYLPEDYEVELVELENGRQLAAECYEPLMQMLADCEAAGHKPYLYSAYRTHSHQQTLFNNMIQQEGSAAAAAKIVARPGTSEHQLGLAVDITDSGYRKLNKQQENTETQKWLMANCWDYGFIVRYPNGTTEITGVIYEPWHYRYVGIELAQELKDSGLTLEEYLDQLTNDGTTCGGKAPETTEPTE